MKVVRVGPRRGLVSGLEQLLQILGRRMMLAGLILCYPLSLLQGIMTPDDLAEYQGVHGGAQAKTEEDWGTRVC